MRSALQLRNVFPTRTLLRQIVAEASARLDGVEARHEAELPLMPQASRRALQSPALRARRDLRANAKSPNLTRSFV